VRLDPDLDAEGGACALLLSLLKTGANRVHAREFYAANGYAVRKEQTNLIKWW
jgi:hypothetical protein